MQNKSFIEQPEDFRKLAFIKAGDALKLIPQAVEKDWWVTAILEAVYTLSFDDVVKDVALLCRNNGGALA